MQRCCPPPPSRKFDITFALRRIRNGILAGFAVCILVLAAPDAHAACLAGEGLRIDGTCGPCPTGQFINTEGVCTDDVETGCKDAGTCFHHACNNARWGSIAPNLFCDINSRNAANGAEKSRCLAPSQDQSSTTPHCSEIFGPYSQDRVRDNNYFPQKPADGSEPHYVYNCDPDGDKGLIPATINTIGATECACPAGQIVQSGVCAACPIVGQGVRPDGTCGACSAGQFVQGGVCIAASADSCGGLTPAKFYDSAAGACVAFVECTAPSVRNAGTNLCDCPAPNAGTDGADAPGDCAVASADSCGGLTPAKFYDSAAGACVAVAACVPPAVLDADANLCDCPSPNIGTDGADAPGDCAVPVPSVGVCGGLTPPQFYDSAAGACVSFAECVAPAVRNAGTNLCDCPSPNVGTDGEDAPGNCAPVAACVAPAVLNTGTNLCDCPAPNVGTDGADAPGDCVAASAQVCRGLTPAKFYDSAAGACVAVAECVAPAVLNAGTNLCDCPPPNVGTDGADAPGDCALFMPSVRSCGGLFPPQFYDSAAGACVPIPDCGAIGAILNAGANRCDCPAESVSRGEVCIPKTGDFRGMSEKLLCGAFGGTVQVATGGREVCSGMDANDTFCIMDSAAGFPCRGLFKHLRSCNVEFDRPALNPFFCGARCAGQKAVGKDCVSL